MQIDGDAVVVTLGRGRQHRVDVESKSDAVELSAVVARRAVVLNKRTQCWQPGIATALSASLGFDSTNEGV